LVILIVTGIEDARYEKLKDAIPDMFCALAAAVVVVVVVVVVHDICSL
jgi:VanZ family protein